MSVGLFIIVSILLTSRTIFTGDFECELLDTERIDCGYLGIGREECVARGCCWKETHSQYPWCFTKRSAFQCGYYEVNRLSLEENIVKADLEFNSKFCPNQFHISDNVKFLAFEAHFDNENQIRIIIKDKENKNWQVPTDISPTYSTSTCTNETFLKTNDVNFFIEQQNGNFFITHQRYRKLSLIVGASKFGFIITRIEDDEILFDTTAHDNLLIFQKFYKKIGTSIPENANIYGLGENVSSFRKNTQNTTITMFNQDSPTFPDVNLYGSHPFYLEHRNGKSHGTFLRNSNGMDIILRDSTILYKVIGGIFDFFFFAGPDPDQVIQQYTDVIGKPFFIPYWSLGFHQCRYGYKNLTEVIEVVDSFKEKMIPLETMWIDIDYMNEFENFSFNPKNFPQAQIEKFVDKLHANDQKFIPIVDPGIKVKPRSKPFEDGILRGIFLKNYKGNPFQGTVWPGLTHFPDFFHPDTENYWCDNLAAFHKLCKFDGLWLDMNEISNFCNGECTNMNSKDKTRDRVVMSTDLSLENPPYCINNSGIGAPLNTKTVEMNCVHYGNILEYDAHNLYGLMESKVTFKVISKIIPGKRPFIISRSTFAGSGAYCGHWTGDNFSDWNNLRYSIPSILNFQLFGIPMVGADICGFIGNADEELCSRWMELGSFYPFSRNHNSLQSTPQEPYRYPTVAEISEKYLNFRYSLLPYWYFLFYTAHNIGSPVWRPLFFEFPSDSNVIHIEEQFMVGSAVLVSPCLYKNAQFTQSYFPQGIWYPLENNGKLVNHTERGDFVELKTPLSYIPVHLRGGYVVPIQEPALKTILVKKSAITLLIALSSSYESNGYFYNDDGESTEVKEFTLLQIKATLLDLQLLDVHIEGVMEKSSKFLLKGLEIFCPSDRFSPTMIFVNNALIASKFERTESYRISVKFESPVLIAIGMTFLIH